MIAIATKTMVAQKISIAAISPFVFILLFILLTQSPRGRIEFTARDL